MDGYLTRPGATAVLALAHLALVAFAFWRTRRPLFTGFHVFLGLEAVAYGVRPLLNLLTGRYLLYGTPAVLIPGGAPVSFLPPTPVEPAAWAAYNRGLAMQLAFAAALVAAYGPAARVLAQRGTDQTPRRREGRGSVTQDTRPAAPVAPASRSLAIAWLVSLLLGTAAVVAMHVLSGGAWLPGHRAGTTLTAAVPYGKILFPLAVIPLAASLPLARAGAARGTGGWIGRSGRGGQRDRGWQLSRARRSAPGEGRRRAKTRNREGGGGGRPHGAVCSVDPCLGPAPGGESDLNRCDGDANLEAHGHRGGDGDGGGDGSGDGGGDGHGNGFPWGTAAAAALVGGSLWAVTLLLLLYQRGYLLTALLTTAFVDERLRPWTFRHLAVLVAGLLVVLAGARPLATTAAGMVAGVVVDVVEGGRPAAAAPARPDGSPSRTQSGRAPGGVPGPAPAAGDAAVPRTTVPACAQPWMAPPASALSQWGRAPAAASQSPSYPNPHPALELARPSLHFFARSPNFDGPDVWVLAQGFTAQHGYLGGWTLAAIPARILTPAARGERCLLTAADLLNTYRWRQFYWQTRFGFNVSLAQEVYLNFGQAALPAAGALAGLLAAAGDRLITLWQRRPFPQPVTPPPVTFKPPEPHSATGPRSASGRNGPPAGTPASQPAPSGRKDGQAARRGESLPSPFQIYGACAVLAAAAFTKEPAATLQWIAAYLLVGAAVEAGSRLVARLVARLVEGVFDRDPGRDPGGGGPGDGAGAGDRIADAGRRIAGPGRRTAASGPRLVVRSVTVDPAGATAPIGTGAPPTPLRPAATRMPVALSAHPPVTPARMGAPEQARQPAPPAASRRLHLPVGVVICRSNPVAPDPRVERVARTLARAGYQVQVVGWNRSVYGRGLRHLPAWLGWQVRLLGWLFRHRRAIDVIHACDFDTLIPALLVKAVSSRRRWPLRMPLPRDRCRPSGGPGGVPLVRGQRRFSDGPGDVPLPRNRRRPSREPGGVPDAHGSPGRPAGPQAVIYDIFDWYADTVAGLPGPARRLLAALDRLLLTRADAVILADERRLPQLGAARPRRLAVIYNSPDWEGEHQAKRERDGQPERQEQPEGKRQGTTPSTARAPSHGAHQGKKPEGERPGESERERAGRAPRQGEGEAPGPRARQGRGAGIGPRVGNRGQGPFRTWLPREGPPCALPTWAPSSPAGACRNCWPSWPATPNGTSTWPASVRKNRPSAGRRRAYPTCGFTGGSPMPPAGSFTPGPT